MVIRVHIWSGNTVSFCNGEPPHGILISEMVWFVKKICPAIEPTTIYIWWSYRNIDHSLTINFTWLHADINQSRSIPRRLHRAGRNLSHMSCNRAHAVNTRRWAGDGRDTNIHRFTSPIRYTWYMYRYPCSLTRILSHIMKVENPAMVVVDRLWIDRGGLVYLFSM